jgi:hypothetical protein
MTASAIDKFQQAATFGVDAPMPVEPGKGLMLVIR